MSPSRSCSVGSGFVVVGEAVQVGEFDGADVVGDEPQGAAGLDGAELPRVAEQPDLRTGAPCVREEFVEAQGAGHAGLVDEEDVAAAQRVPGVRGMWSLEFVQELVHVLRPAAEFGAEDFGRLRRGGQRDDSSTGGFPGLAGGAHRGGLARAGRTYGGDDSAVVADEALGQRALT